MRIESATALSSKFKEAQKLLEFDFSEHTTPRKSIKRSLKVLEATATLIPSGNPILPDGIAVRPYFSRISTRLESLLEGLPRLSIHESNGYLRLCVSELSELLTGLNEEIEMRRMEQLAAIEEAGVKISKSGPSTKLNSFSDLHEFLQRNNPKKQAVNPDADSDLPKASARWIKELEAARERYSSARKDVPDALPRGQDYVIYRAPLMVLTEEAVDTQRLSRVSTLSFEELHPGIIFKDQLVAAFSKDQVSNPNFYKPSGLFHRILYSLRQRTRIDYMNPLSERPEYGQGAKYFHVPGSQLCHFWLIPVPVFNKLGHFEVTYCNVAFVTPNRAETSSPDVVAQLRQLRQKADAYFEGKAAPKKRRLEKMQKELESIVKEIKPLEDIDDEDATPEQIDRYDTLAEARRRLNQKIKALTQEIDELQSAILKGVREGRIKLT